MHRLCRAAAGGGGGPATRSAAAATGAAHRLLSGAAVALRGSLRAALTPCAPLARLHVCSAASAPPSAPPSPAVVAAAPAPAPAPAALTTTIKPQLDYKSIVARREYVQANVVNR